MFAEGTEVYYKQFHGYISFICDHSVSILIRKGKHPSQDVNLVVYKSDWKQIRLFKESDK
jgi:hypothetical protein